MTDLYQSNGACQTTCNGYAFAVVQAQSCWCSNYAPADTTSTSDCSESCPGYPDENCGSTSSGLFGYVALGKAPSGTTGASPSTSSMEATPTSTTVDPVQAVSTQPLPTVLFGTTLALEATSSFSSSTISVLRAPLPSVGISAAIPLAAISYRTHVLTPSLQTFTPDPVSVTVLETVTESPSVQISLVSIVRLHPPLFFKPVIRLL